jgi:DNA-binding XRE family transcriptional regulator
MSNLPENIKFLRLQAGLSQEDLAEKINKTRHSIVAYETGRAKPPINILILLSRIFSTPIDDMVNKSFNLV